MAQHAVAHFTRAWSYPAAPNPEQGRPDIAARVRDTQHVLPMPSPPPYSFAWINAAKLQLVVNAVKIAEKQHVVVSG